jgi:hypothetical protein
MKLLREVRYGVVTPGSSAVPPEEMLPVEMIGEAVA